MVDPHCLNVNFRAFPNARVLKESDNCFNMLQFGDANFVLQGLCHLDTHDMRRRKPCAIHISLIFTFVLCNSFVPVVCSYGGRVAAVRMALSMDDICDAQTEAEAYNCLQPIQGKHVPQLLGYGHSGQNFCVATSYIQAC